MSSTMKKRQLSLASAFIIGLVGLGPSATTSHAQCDPLMTFTAESANDGFGSSLANAGDVNNDGFSDLIIGAADLGAGRAYVYSGQTGELLYSFTGEATGDLFGVTVDGAGDVNNDGFADVIIGASRNNAGGEDAGKAYIYSGQTGNMLYSFEGNSNNNLGSHVSGAGDINNDGNDDFIVFKTFDFVSDTLITSGWARVYSGKTGDVLLEYPSYLHYSLTSAGDINNDGYDDLISGSSYYKSMYAPDSVGVGLSVTYSGKTGEILQSFAGELEGERIGASATGAGDLDKDGFDDIVYGMGSLGNTEAFVRSGQTGEVLFTFRSVENSGQYSDAFGGKVAAAGDVNSDGFPDIIVGAPFTNFGGKFTGRAYVFSGRTGGLLYSITGASDTSLVGWKISGAGDINNDGFADIMLLAKNSAGDGISTVSIYSRCSCCDTPGDANNDGAFNIADITAGIATIFSGAQTATCQDEADANGDNSFNIADVTLGIARIFNGASAPTCGATSQ